MKSIRYDKYEFFRKKNHIAYCVPGKGIPSFILKINAISISVKQVSV